VTLRALWRGEASGRLRLLILAVADRCDQRCVHCQIWMGQGGTRPALSLAERLAIVDDALAAGAREALLTGGEPLLSADLWPVAERLRAGGARLMLATNGMLLSRHATSVARFFDEVYVSLDGASAVSHDAQRGVAAFDRVLEGVAALRRSSSRMRVVARSTLHAGNMHEVEAIVDAARSAGFHHVSFLPIDAGSTAFGGDPGARERLVPGEAQVRDFEAAVERMESEGALADGFVLEPAGKLRGIARHLRASAGAAPFERPACDAPWWSSVVETDGSVRPCFFHEAIGDAREGLAALRDSDRYGSALAAIRAPNPTCARCVCPKQRGTGILARLWA
jgi:MoaA/NifB/PqqE/SkfB family radical SAM enzyme